jgi:hypothetical protein
MTRWIHLRFFAGLTALCTLASCSSPERRPEPVAEVIASETSFRCIRNMTPVRGLFVDNLLGNVAGTVAAAQANNGGPWPPGSLVQVVPTSAMVKHQPGRSPETNDWEFIELAPTADRTTIVGRGFAEMNMRSGANCLNCHKPAQAKWDLICEQTHGCLPIPLTPVVIRALQNSDPRCPKIELPKEQADALAALAAPRPQPAGETRVER